MSSQITTDGPSLGLPLNTSLPATLLTTHLVFQKCSLSSEDRGYIYIYTNPCKFGGKNSHISFKYPRLKQLISEQSRKDVTPLLPFLCWLLVEEKVLAKMLACIFKSTYMTE